MRLSRRLVLTLPGALIASGAALAEPTPAPKDAALYFITPRNGQRLQNPVVVTFGLRNMGIAPAGVRTANTGHHHLFVDVDEPLDPRSPIPQDKKHLHFGAGQTETKLDLAPGPHTLQLVLGDADHVPFDPPLVSKKIRIVVLAAKSAKQR